MEDSVNDRVKRIIDHLNINTTQFAKSIDTAQSVLATMFARGTEPSSKILRNIINTYDIISAEWLLTGKGSMLKSEAPLANDRDAYSTTQTERKIKRLEASLDALIEQNEKLKAELFEYKTKDAQSKGIA